MTILFASQFQKVDFQKVDRNRLLLLILEIEKFNVRQPPKGEKDDYDSENSWISDGFPSSSRQRRRGDGR